MKEKIPQGAGKTGDRKQNVFYGWIMVICVCVILFLAFGSVYSFTTFFASFQMEFGTSRSSTSLVFAIAGFIYFSLGAISGQVSDRMGSRWVIAAGVFVISLGLLLSSFAVTVEQIYLVYGLGIGLGTLGMPAFSAFLIHLSDWRTAYMVMSACVFCCGIAAAMLIVDSPEKMGLLPDGERTYRGDSTDLKNNTPKESRQSEDGLTVTADYFSGANISGILGALYTSVAFGNLLGPTFAGYMFDIWQSYEIPIVMSILAAIVAAICTLFLEKPASWRENFFQ